MKILSERYLIQLKFISFKNLKIFFKRYIIALRFIVFSEFKDSVAKMAYPSDVYYFLRIWRFCWKDTLSHWNLLFIKIWRFSWKDILSDWHLLFFNNLKILLEIYFMSLTSIVFEGWKFFLKDNLYQWQLPILRIWRFCWTDILTRLKFIIS